MIIRPIRVISVLVPIPFLESNFQFQMPWNKFQVYHIGRADGTGEWVHCKPCCPFETQLPRKKGGAHGMMTMGLNIECRLTNNE